MFIKRRLALKYKQWVKTRLGSSAIGDQAKKLKAQAGREALNPCTAGCSVCITRFRWAAISRLECARAFGEQKLSVMRVIHECLCDKNYGLIKYLAKTLCS